MSVVTSFEDVGPCRKKMTIEVPAPAVEAEIGRVVDGYRRQVSIPGFRKGKVPASLLRKRFREDIEREVADRLVPRYWHQAQAEKSLDPLLPPQVEELEIEAGKPLTFTAVVEVRPDITIGEIADFELPEGQTEPGEDEKDDALRNLRRGHATWTSVERGASRGDMVIGLMHRLDEPATAEELSQDESSDSESAEGEVAVDAEAEDSESSAAPEPLQVELGAQGVEEELTLALTGLTAGQNTEYTRRHEHEGETHEHKFRIEVEEVKEPELPELNDDLAEKFGFKSASELESAVLDNLRSTKEQELRGQRQKALLEQLRERYPVELPEGVVEHESEEMLQDTMQRLGGQGVDLDQMGIDWKKVVGDMRPQAEQRVHERLVLDAVGAHLQLKLDESAFEQFLTMAAAERRMSSQVLRQQLSENGRLEPLRAQLLRDQTVRHLLGEGDAEEDAAAPEDTDEDAAAPDAAAPDDVALDDKETQSASDEDGTDS